MTVPATVPAGEAVAEDDLSLDAVLARFDGNDRAALAAALADIAMLRSELTFASLTMSYGFARGWKPALAGKPAAL